MKNRVLILAFLALSSHVFASAQSAGGSAPVDATPPTPPIPFGHNALPPDFRWDDSQLHREWRAIVEPAYLLGTREAAARRAIEDKVAQIASFTARQRRTPAFHTRSCEAISAVNRLRLVLLESDQHLVALTALSLRYSGRMSEGDIRRMAGELVQYQTYMVWRWQDYRRYADQVDFSRSGQCSVEYWTRERLERERLRSEAVPPESQEQQ